MRGRTGYDNMITYPVLPLIIHGTYHMMRSTRRIVLALEEASVDGYGPPILGNSFIHNRKFYACSYR